ncbi:HEAT repeat domain-containing protein [Sphingomonas psychrotolerans]|uniref:HEAT repeat domain-containing protein n=1 Tax=Sphingomonas psychrotolerans TaxID=1327635 RepID=A0ABU3N0L8_9SPHN|nr:HEAT repeat domain-containing protein [Sphingomonas psychrotolerans]MDT8758032.1 HEAT repeat domain-containing protein [Sphingomonas psychrotolerans]
MRLPEIADHVARLAIFVSIWGTLAMAALLLFLVIRRDRKERSRAAAETNSRSLTREILAALPGGPGLGDAYQRASPEQRLAAVSHLGRLVRGDDRIRLTAFVDRHRLVDRVLAKARRQRTARRVDAVRMLGGVGGVEAVTALDTLLRHDKALPVRLEAAAMLARLEALPAATVLVEALSLEQVPVTPLHHALFRALAPYRAGELLALAGRPLSPPLHALIIDALGWTEDYSTLSTLAAASASPATEVRLAAIAAAVRLNHPAAAKWLLPLLDDPEPEVRAQAVRACGTMGLRNARAKIEAMRSDPSRWVRLRAVEAAMLLGRPA